MSIRLETVSENLAAKITAANPSQRRKAITVACELAVQATGMNIPIVTESLEQVRQKGRLSQKRIMELNQLVIKFDEEHFRMQDSDEENEALQAESLRLFSQARVVSAISYAGQDDTLIAATESIYEAAKALDDNNKFFAVVMEALSA